MTTDTTTSCRCPQDDVSQLRVELSTAKHDLDTERKLGKEREATIAVLALALAGMMLLYLVGA